MRGYPQFYFRIPITLAKACFSRVVTCINRAKISLGGGGGGEDHPEVRRPCAQWQKEASSLKVVVTLVAPIGTPANTNEPLRNPSLFVVGSALYSALPTMSSGM